MTYFLITFRSVTFAQQAQRLLSRYAISCTLQRTPKHLAERGCGYCLRLRDRDALNAVELVRQHTITYGKVYAVQDDGVAEERLL